MSDKTTKAKAAAEEAGATLSEEIREEIRIGTEDLSEKAQEGIKDLEVLIKEHPVQSVLVAFGIGFILSRLLSR